MRRRDNLDVYTFPDVLSASEDLLLMVYDIRRGPRVTVQHSGKD